MFDLSHLYQNENIDGLRSVKIVDYVYKRTGLYVMVVEF